MLIIRGTIPPYYPAHIAAGGEWDDMPVSPEHKSDFESHPVLVIPVARDRIDDVANAVAETLRQFNPKSEGNKS